MKLLHCRHCGDVVRLFAEPRSCHCGRSRGWYASDTHTLLFGPCRALGIDTGELTHAASGTWAESDRVMRIRDPRAGGG